MGFKIGEIIRFKDGDGRPHKIVDITPRSPLNRNERTFFEFVMEDGAKALEENMEYYKGDYNRKKKFDEKD